MDDNANMLQMLHSKGALRGALLSALQLFMHKVLSSQPDMAVAAPDDVDVLEALTSLKSSSQQLEIRWFLLRVGCLHQHTTALM